MANLGDSYTYGGPTGYTEDPLYKERQRVSLSEASFLKNPLTSGPRNTINRRNSDQRNVPDDLIKRERMKTLMRFLSWQEYPSEISFNDLQAPHRSLLISLWNFILKRVDESIEINTKNANEEVPRIFKELGYHSAISKSSMVAPGTGHQWFHHLTALSWLCELLIYENAIFPSISQGSGVKISDLDNSFGTSLINSKHADPTTKEILISTVTLNKLVSKSFIPCMTGNENKDAIKNAVLSQLEVDLDILRASHQKKANKLKELDLEHKRLQSIIQDHIQKSSEINEMQKKYNHFEDRVEEIRKQIPMADKRIKMNEKSISSKNIELEREISTVTQLRDQLQKQSLSHNEVLTLKNTIQDHHDAIRKYNETLETLDEDNRLKKEQITNYCEELEKYCNSINEKLLISRRNVKKLKSPSIKLWDQLLAFSFTFDSPTVDKMLNVEWKKQKELLENIIKEEETYLQKIKSELSAKSVPNQQKQLEILIEKTKILESDENNLKKALEDLEMEMNTKLQEINKIKEEALNQLELEEAELTSKLSRSQAHSDGLQEALQKQTQKHFQECIEKWENIEDMCKDLSHAKINSINGFQRLVDIKIEKLHKLNITDEVK